MATKDIADYSLEELTQLLAEKKQTEIDVTATELKAAREIVTKLEAKLASLTGSSTPNARGRKKGSKTKGKKAKGKRSGMTVKEAILQVLGKGPASSSEIIKGTGLKAPSVNQTLMILKKEKAIKKESKRGGKYSLK
jgi:hypothetical protein